MTTNGTKQSRPLYEIAAEIRKEWAKVNYAAKPYLEELRYWGPASVFTDKYGMDNAESIVAHLLVNASSFRGDTAKRIKAELKQMVK